MSYPQLPESVALLDGLDLSAVWERFHVFEAMHHEMDVCNPMSDGDLGEVLDVLKPADGDHLLDIACGHGEFLLRAAALASIFGHGIDLSPWVLMRAERRSRELGVEDRLRWTLGDAGELPVDGTADIAACFGASWIWGGFEGTVDALISHTRPGGRFAVGDVRRRAGTDVAELTDAFANVSSRDEQMEILASKKLRVLGEIVPDAESWVAYDHRVTGGAQSFQTQEPGPIATEAVGLQSDWARDHAAARRVVEWTVWVLETPTR